ncbi:MAG: four helix bundle protein [Ferruginibacter sp.]|nr:four helix bundle protein [Ferruginibacter sp.]
MKKELLDSNPILKLSIDFSIMIIDYCEKLESNKKYILKRQLFRSGTSIGANAMEAQNAECKADFIHKMKIASKKAEESQYWLLLCQYSTNYPDCILAQSKLEEVNKVLDKILATSKKKSPSSIC